MSERVSEAILREEREDRIMVPVSAAQAAMEQARQEGDEDGYKRGLADERMRIVEWLRSSAATASHKPVFVAIEQCDHWKTDG